MLDADEADVAQARAEEAAAEGGMRRVGGAKVADPTSTQLSYWTDNGAAYWYRTEPGRTIGASVIDAVDAWHGSDAA